MKIDLFIQCLWIVLAFVYLTDEVFFKPRRWEKLKEETIQKILDRIRPGDK